jgi:hypothetical protein
MSMAGLRWRLDGEADQVTGVDGGGRNFCIRAAYGKYKERK